VQESEAHFTRDGFNSFPRNDLRSVSLIRKMVGLEVWAWSEDVVAVGDR
jgi:hypothetical protein